MTRIAEMYNFTEKFFDLVQQEVSCSREIYENNFSLSLQKYYHNLLGAKNFSQYIKYFYIERVFPLIKLIKKGTKILDAGCGLGTESLLFGVLGAKVVGIDLAKDRISVANERIKYFETQYNKKLNITYNLEDVFKHKKRYDIIWVNEAISHIDPVQDFLKICFMNLKVNGKLIIADANKLNPYIYLQSKKDQIKSGGIYKKIKIENLNQNQDISYAVERIFSVPSITRLLSQYFTVQKVKFLRILPFSLFRMNPHFMKKVEKEFLLKIPLFNQFSGSYVIISSKKNN